MAEYQAPMAENLRRSVGNVTYYVMHGKTFARAKVAHVKKSDSPQQLRQRVIFGLLIQLSKVLLKTTRVSFPQRVNGRSSSNEFVHLNRNSVTVNDKFEATINLEELKVSNGELAAYFKVNATYNADTKKIIFEQEAPTVSDFNGAPDDILYVTLLETKANRSGLVTLRPRDESGSTSVQLPDWWEIGNCKAYLFALSKDGHLASSTQYLSVGTE